MILDVATMTLSLLRDNYGSSPLVQGAGGEAFGRGLGFRLREARSKHSGYAPSRISVSATSYAAERMLGEPTTPLFSINDFISLEPYQVRAFDTSATSWRSSTSLGSSALRNTLLFVIPADVRFF